MVQNSTFYINHADTGGALDHFAGDMRVRNSIMAGSMSLDSTYNSLNCDGPMLTSLGGNLASDP